MHYTHNVAYATIVTCPSPQGEGFLQSPKGDTKLNQAQLQQIEAWIEANPNIIIKEMRIKIQEKFELNISKSTVHRHMQKMKFSYIIPIPAIERTDRE